MYCGNCGSKANDKDKFCNECGAPLKSETNSSISNHTSELKKAENFINIMTENNNLLSDIEQKTSPAYNKNYESSYNPKNKNNTLKSAIIVTTIFLLFVIVTVVFINRNEIFHTNNGKRTIMIYMVGSDLESKYVAATQDIEEMIGSNADFENINLLIYTGGAKTWHKEEISSDENAIYKVNSDGLEKLKTYKITNMGEPKPLLDFINYAYDNYKAEKYSLILWDHGGGPIYGYGRDEYYETNPLTLLELENVLERSPFGNNNKLELIGFDACLMSSAEIAYILSDYADYMVASQEVEPGAGWNYNFLKNIKKDSTTYEIGKSIIDEYTQYYKNKINGKGISLSLLKLNKMDFLEQKLNLLFKDIDEDLVIDFSDISRSRGNSKTFGKVTASSYDLVDLYDLLDKLPDKYYTKVDSLKSAIKDLVVYQKTDLSGANGISIYFPYENKKRIDDLLYLYKKFGFADGYTEFISNFSNELTGTRIYNWNLENNKPVAKEDGLIEIDIPQEVAENYSTASYIIFEKIDNDYYMPRFKGTDVTLNGTTLSTTISKKALVATGKDKQEVYITSLEAEKGEGYTKYIIPGTLQNWSSDFLDSFEMLPVYIQLIVDEENPNGKIAGAIEIVSDEENNVSPKVTVDINDWKIIQLLNYKYKIFDEAGNYTTNWTSSGEITGFEAEIKEGFKLEFKDLDVSKEYYCLFKISDSQGNIYNTNVVKVEK